MAGGDRFFTPRGRLLRVITASHRAVYRVSGGRLGTKGRGMPMLLLTTTGRRSGREHTVPLPFFADGDRMVVVASFAGNPAHPAWYLNLAEHPDVTVQYRGERFPALAEKAAGDERARLWARVVSEAPWYDDYQAQTARQIPLVVLQRR